MDPELISALRTAKYMYLTTYSRAGRRGTVPVWLWYHDGAVYFTTQRTSLKARRIRKGLAIKTSVLIRITPLGTNDQ
ncbi:MAG: pyridoxamine 5'-phosphate oxidase family protein [candidate division NC10 bacterium]|nr:pyridoxamine 5'-phosphate oxidase family protein [candidate division NC10 bacterium]